MDDNLKPCPFCGGEANVEKRGDSYVVKRFHKDSCYLVGRTLHKYHIKEAVVKKWNRRVIDDTTERS